MEASSLASGSPTPSSAASSDIAASCAVLVVGGATAGLLAGVSLSALGLDVHIYEQAADPNACCSPEAGVQVTEELQAWAAAHKVPLPKRVASAGRQVLAADGDVMLSCATAQEYVSLPVLRSALLAAFPGAHYHAGARVAAVDVSDPDFVVIELERGERIAGHMLVAADGASSLVRQAVLPNCQPSFAGYLAWRGVAQAGALSPFVQELLMDKASLYKGPRLHVQVHPLPLSAGDGESQPLAWTWFNNQHEEELPGLLLDSERGAHASAVPMGHLHPSVADAVAAAAAQALPEPLAELVAKSGRMSVAAIRDMALPRHAVGRVALVGEAGCVLRPHGCSALQKAVLDAASLADALRAKRLAVDKALQAWDAAAVQRSVALCRAAAAAGERLQGAAA